MEETYLQIKKFLQQLQTGVFLTSFDDTHFQSLAAIPQVKLEKSSKQKYWIGRVWLVDELFYYNYPFYLPNLFQQKTKIKKSFIRLVKYFEKHDFIESKYKVFSNGISHNVQELTTKNVSEGFLVYEKFITF